MKSSLFFVRGSKASHEVELFCIWCLLLLLFEAESASEGPNYHSES